MEYLKDLLETNVLQRLRNIHQGGAIFLVRPSVNYSRYEHSLGVSLLIRQLGGTLQEQIAGLLHDISHTAFSHLIDYVPEVEEEDYHEKRFLEVLYDKDLQAVLEKHGYQAEDFSDLEKYPLLEYPLPGLSADRIDYTLRDLFQLKVLSKEEITWFLGGLEVFEGRIIARSEEYGRWLQEKYKYPTEEYFASKENR